VLFIVADISSRAVSVVAGATDATIFAMICKAALIVPAIRSGPFVFCCRVGACSRADGRA
jgi:hypothetical protein